MYTSAIIQFLTWPVLIIISYQIVKLMVKKYESKMEEKNDDSV